MREYERREKKAVDRALVDLQDERDHLSIRISLFKDREPVDADMLAAMKRNLWLLDGRIAKHCSSLGTYAVG